MKFQQALQGLFIFLSLLSITFAASTPANIGTSMMAFCGTLKGALAVGMMLLIVLAAITYAVGQVMGAETRARASVWATAMFTGALVGALIYIIMPYIISLLINGTASTEWVNSCCVDPPTGACKLITP